MPQLVAGDIGAVTKLNTTGTGSTLAPAHLPVTVATAPMPTAHLAVALVPVTQSDDDKLSEALHKLVVEDPSLRISYDDLSRRTVLHGTGDAHLAVALSRLERRYGVHVTTDAVRIPYRRTITQTVEVEGRLKKQSGGHGQFAVVSLRVSPLEPGGGFEFVDAIVGGAIPKNYVAAVKHGVRGGDGERCRQRRAARRRPGRVRRRQDPLGRLVRHGVQDRRRDRPRRGDRQGWARAARTGVAAAPAGAGRVTGRRARRPRAPGAAAWWAATARTACR